MPDLGSDQDLNPRNAGFGVTRATIWHEGRSVWVIWWKIIYPATNYRSDSVVLNLPRLIKPHQNNDSGLIVVTIHPAREQEAAIRRYSEPMTS